MLLILATRNQNKTREIQAALDLPGLTLKTAADLPGAPEVEETAATMEGNAVLKARALARHGRGWALADDSGLEVEALQGAPGVYSARYAGPQADDAENNRKLLNALRGVDNRRARFRCVLALSSPSGEVRTLSGTCEGLVAAAPRGKRGFGYDPLFIPVGGDRSFAELAPEDKNRISHRGRALAAARTAWGAWLRTHPRGWPRQPAPIERIPDGEQRLARQDAFWDRAILDRPVVCIRIDPSAAISERINRYPSNRTRQRWLDTEYQAERALHSVQASSYYGDALPRVYPNLGPEVFSAYFGMPLEFGESTSWSVPLLRGENTDHDLTWSQDNPFWRKTLELTAAMLEVGRGVFYTGVTDLHPGGDALAALRDPQQLAFDLVERPEQVQRWLHILQAAFFEIFGIFSQRLQVAGQACCTWMQIVSSRRWHVPSNDFSCMISEAMFRDFFLPGIAAECTHAEASIYHLDGPGALRHLDALLEIPQLDAVQWVWGAGNGRASDWLHVFRKCQAAGKGIYVHAGADELADLMASLRPEGVWLGLTGVTDAGQAEALIREVRRWR